MSVCTAAVVAGILFFASSPVNGPWRDAGQAFFAWTGFEALHPGPAPAFAEQAKKVQTRCPVMGGEIDRNVYVDHQGKRIYFCCAGCIDTFNKDPEGTVGKMESKGIVLKKTPR